MAGLVRQVRAQAAKLETLSDTDELTGAPNRRVWFRQIPYEIARAQRSGRPLSVAIIDIDHFKAYNDTYDCDLESATRAMERLSSATPSKQTCSTGVACFTGELGAPLPGECG